MVDFCDFEKEVVVFRTCRSIVVVFFGRKTLTFCRGIAHDVSPGSSACHASLQYSVMGPTHETSPYLLPFLLLPRGVLFSPIACIAMVLVTSPIAINISPAPA
jgi:hypothetical protein